MKEYNRQNFLHELLNMGEILLANGAEVNRVEDTINRMGQAYGAEKMNTFVITSSMIVTITYPDGETFTESRRLLKPGGTDFYKVELCNALSRECCRNPKTVEELGREIKKIKARPVNTMKSYLGSILAAGGFAVFFGGGIWDGLVAGLVGILICLCQRKLDAYCANKFMFNLLCSLAMGILICLIAKPIPILRVDKIIIGDIMLLIPGLAMTNAVRDIIVGDTISGIMRLVESMLWALALASGIMLAIWMIM